MKKLVLSAFCVVSVVSLQAQLYNDGSLYIENGGLLYIEQDLTNTATAQLSNLGTLTVGGNLTNNAATTAFPGSILVFNGTTRQTISGTARFNATNVEFNNSSNVLLQQLFSVSGTATFTNGDVEAPMNAAPLVFTGASAAIAGAANAHNVIGWTGVEGRTAFDFPVGDGSNLKTVSLTAIQSPSNLITVSYGGNTNKVVNGTVFTPPMINVSNSWWTINAPSNTVTINLYTKEADDQAGAVDITDLQVARRDAGSWVLLPSTVAGTIANGIISSSSVANFGVFAVGNSGSSLPVTLLDFRGKRVGAGIDLTWKVTGDYDAALYTIERSADAIHWTVLGDKTPQNSTEMVSYVLHDPAPYTPVSYYRLKTKENTGSVAYSKVVSFRSAEANLFRVIPNMVTGGTARLYNGSAIGVFSCMITDAQGKVYKRFTLNSAEQALDINGLANGKYQLIITDKGKVLYTLPFVVAQ